MQRDCFKAAAGLQTASGMFAHGAPGELAAAPPGFVRSQTIQFPTGSPAGRQAPGQFDCLFARGNLVIQLGIADRVQQRLKCRPWGQTQ